MHVQSSNLAAHAQFATGPGLGAVEFLPPVWRSVPVQHTVKTLQTEGGGFSELLQQWKLQYHVNQVLSCVSLFLKLSSVSHTVLEMFPFVFLIHLNS